MGIDLTLQQALTASIETVINGVLRYDPASRRRLAQITDILAIEITSTALTPTITLYFRGQDDGLAVFSHCETPVTTHLQGSAIALAGLLKQPTNLSQSGVHLVGSTGLLQQWQTVLAELDIDWEDAISQILGDIAGPLASSGLRRSASWAKDQATEQQRLISEYLPEEMNVVPSQAEFEQWVNEVRELNLDTDRLEARIKQFKQKLHARAEANASKNEDAQ